MTKESRGEDIDVSPEAIATLAAQAAMGVEGVVACYRKPVESITSRMKREFVHKGVRVEREGESCRLALYLKVAYGINLPAMAREVKNRVKEYVEGLTDIRVEEVEVVIEDIEPPRT